jgi:uncharacterized protein YprB with RNaseH-like and TPR domain
MSEAKVLFLDIETAPILSYHWKLWDENIGLNQIKADWHLLSFAGKWLGDKEVIYQDQRKARKIDNDAPLLKEAWALLDEADIVVWQNGRRFDHKKLNARFIMNGMSPPSPYKQIDTLEIAKKHFGFTSNKLEYLSNTLNVKYKKLSDHDFHGFNLWKECLAGNHAAWRTMEKYNKHDVLALEELYTKLIPWDQSLNFSLFREDGKQVCTCGSKEFHKRGYAFTSAGKYQRYQCQKCGAWTRGASNLLSKEQRAETKRVIP